MTAIQLNIPIEVDINDTKRFIAAKLYESGKLSLGHAAEIAGLSKVAFAEILGDYDVCLINYPISEIISDAAKI